MRPVGPATFSVHRSAVVAHALHHRLARADGLTSLGWAVQSSDALYREGDPVDVWLVDDRLPHDGGRVLCERLASRDRVVVLADLAGSDGVARTLPLVELGVAGVVDVDSRWSTLLRALQAVAAGTWLPRGVGAQLLLGLPARRADDDDVLRRLLRLTERERTVLLALSAGAGRDEVARSLSISVHTVRTHVQRIMEKFEVHSHPELVALSVAHRLPERFGEPSPEPAPAPVPIG